MSTIADFSSGLSLAGATPATIGIAVVVVIMVALTTAVVYLGARRNKRSALFGGPSKGSSIPMNDYKTSRGDGQAQA